MQLLSWVAIYHRAGANHVVRAPQPRMADKGFDGVFVETGTALLVTICEDKATEDARRTIRADVWPELAGYEAGKRDNELRSEITTLLQTAARPSVDNDLATMDWDAKRYRVSTTVEHSHADSAAVSALFKSFDVQVSGSVDRRCGETFAVNDVRDWMTVFCSDVIAKLKSLES